MAIPVIAVVDIGKTNKKVFLFDENYRAVFEKTATLNETKDEDGDPCEDVQQLGNFMHEALQEVLLYKYYDLKAINFSAYGASFVCIKDRGKVVTPLYNYLKPYPSALQKQFYDRHGGEKIFSQRTASPVLGSLNSGMQLYRLRHQKPDVFEKIKYALHLPQYLSYMITGQAFSDMTSIGCHTNLWDFNTQDYHRWVREEGVERILPPIKPAAETIPVKYEGRSFVAGVGLHDSSAALIPYMMNFDEPFVLLSTGTWSISLNPFNHSPLTSEELESDCLSYISYYGTPVKASRVFSGNEYEREIKRLAAHYHKSTRYFHSMDFKPALAGGLDKSQGHRRLEKESMFNTRSLSDFSSDEEAYHQLMFDLVAQQYQSTQLIVRGSPVKRIFVDGGFSKNLVFMNLLSQFFPTLDVYAASLSHGTALGSALAIHASWNSSPMPANLIALTLFGKKEVGVRL